MLQNHSAPKPKSCGANTMRRLGSKEVPPLFLRFLLMHVACLDPSQLLHQVMIKIASDFIYVLNKHLPFKMKITTLLLSLRLSLHRDPTLFLSSSPSGCGAAARSRPPDHSARCPSQAHPRPRMVGRMSVVKIGWCVFVCFVGKKTWRSS